MFIFFDVDGTITVDHHWKTLRPGTIDLFEKLDKSGHMCFLWSRRGTSHCRHILKQFPITFNFVHGVAEKPYKRDMGNGETPSVQVMGVQDRWTTKAHMTPHICVDNSGVHLLQAYGGVRVPSYRDVNETSPEVMERVRDVILFRDKFKPYVDLKR